MIGWVCLGAGVVCALIARGLLFTAAFSISIWWAAGVLLPFGPLFFRLSYPEKAARARIFSRISVPCYLAFMVIGPGFSAIPSFHKKTLNADLAQTSKPVGFAMETPIGPEAAPPIPNITLEQRRAANEAEFARLRDWGERLGVTKRNLLASDTEGGRRFNEEATQFNAALAAAHAEKAALDSAH